MATIQADPRRKNRCRVHVYFGSLCKAEVVDMTVDFSENLNNILSDFGLDKDKQKDYCLKLMSGGLVEKNDVLFQEDKI